MPKGCYDVIVVGAGHAGCEAAIASARLGCKTLVITLNIDNIALMSCNPAIGGIAKGHIVREIDALGGEMARITDLTGIQFRMLNTSKGPAVQALRAQVDRNAYKLAMRSVLESYGAAPLLPFNLPLPHPSLLRGEGWVRGLFSGEPPMSQRITKGHGNPICHPDPELVSGSGVSGSKEMLKQVQHDKGQVFSDETGVSQRLTNDNENHPLLQGEDRACPRNIYRGVGMGLFSGKNIDLASPCDILFLSSKVGMGLFSGKNIDITQGMVERLIVKDGKVRGIETNMGTRYEATAVILTTGTFLRGLIHIGMVNYPAGRAGEFPATGLSEDLKRLGFTLGRLKTGTPPRLDARSIDFSVMTRQEGDDPPHPFSYMTEKIERPQVPCYLTYTSPATHEIIKKNLDRSPLYGGVIKGIGPRYCPSIEDKVVRFSHREKHQVFLEPEGYETIETYANGISTSMPVDVQIEMVRSIRGLEEAEIIRAGYAIEYDFVPPTQLKHTLETKLIEGLYNAGQINGTSGYEEAAAQGIMAGINAALKIQGREPFILDRSEAYIGVLIDDLITKGTQEPYRMFTSRAEYRLLLRHDNADSRLTEKGYNIGIISPDRYKKFVEKKTEIENEIARLKKTRLPLKRENTTHEHGNAVCPEQRAVSRELAELSKDEQWTGFADESSRSVGTAHRKGRGMVGIAHPTQGFSGETPMSRRTTKDDENPICHPDHSCHPELVSGSGVSGSHWKEILKPLNQVQGQNDRWKGFSGKTGGIGRVSPDTTLARLLQRPEMDYTIIERLAPAGKSLSNEVKRSVEIEIKYDGYIKRQLQLIEKFKNMEDKRIPADFDYSSIHGFSREVIEKLTAIKPASLGQASRVPGVTPAAVSILAITLAKQSRRTEKQ